MLQAYSSPQMTRRAVAMPMIWAAQSGNVNQVHAHLQGGAPVDGFDDKGYAPLHYACESGNLDLASLLVRQGAAVNQAVSATGWTPLHLAAKGGHKTVAELLLANGANPQLLDAFRNTPLDLAVGNRQDAMADFLRAAYVMQLPRV